MKKLLIGLALLGAIFAPSFAYAQPLQPCYRDASSGITSYSCQPAIQADKSGSISIAGTATTQLVALVTGRAIYITNFNFMAADTNAVSLVYGTGTACGTGQVALTGAYPLVAQAGISAGVGMGPVLIVPQGNALCIITSTSNQLSGSFSYVQF